MSGTWNYTLDDTSPVIKYGPYSDGDILGGWQTWYSGSGFNKQFGEASSGDSFHLSSFSGASLSLSFFGTGVSLIGTANCSYQVTVDGSLKPNGSPPFNTLFNEEDLEVGIHNITLSVTEISSGGMVQFDKAVLFSPVSEQQNVPVMERIDNQNTSVITYTPNAWQTQNDAQIPSRQNPSAYQQTNVFEASAWLNFTGRAVEVRGESNFGWWTYEVVLDEQRYTGFNASNSWIVPDAVLFYQDGLDETVPHTLNITNTGSGGMDMALNSVTAFHFGIPLSQSNGTDNSPSGTSPSGGQKGGVSGGVVAGAIVASLAGTSILLGLLFFFLKRQKQASSPDCAPQHNNFLDALKYPTGNMKEAHAKAPLINRSSEPDTIRSQRLEPGFTIGNPGAGSDSFTTTPTFILPSDSAPPTQRTMSPSGTNEPTASRPNEKGHRNTTQPAQSPGQYSAASHAGAVPDAGDDSAVDRIANVVAERIAQRFGGRSGEDLLSPPPEYVDHVHV